MVTRYDEQQAENSKSHKM